MESMYQICFYGGLILAVAMFITCVVLFFVLKIPHTIGELTGGNARKSIKEMGRGASRTLSQSVTKREQAKYYNVGAEKITVKEASTADKSTSGVPKKPDVQPEEELTEVLGAGRLAEPEEEMTEVLGAGRLSADDVATDGRAGEGEFDGDAATDVLKANVGFDGDAATDVLTSSSGGDDAATDVLVSEHPGRAGEKSFKPAVGASAVDSESETTVLAEKGIKNPKIRVIKNEIVINTIERL